MNEGLNKWLEAVSKIANDFADSVDDYRSKLPKETNLEAIKRMSKEEQIEFFADAIYDWAGCPDSYIYDLNRCKSAFILGTMSFEDFEEWNYERCREAAEELVEWLNSEVKKDSGI